MTIKSDLENALALLEQDVATHVSALALARKSVLDTQFITEATARVIAATEALSASHAGEVAPVAQVAPAAPVAPVVAPPLPSFLLPQTNVTVPAVVQSALGPSVAESLAEAIAAAHANEPR